MWWQLFLSLFETRYLRTVDSALELAGVAQHDPELLIPLLYPHEGIISWCHQAWRVLKYVTCKEQLQDLTRCARDLLGKNICEGRGDITRGGCGGGGSFRSQRKIETCEGAWG